MKQLPFLSYKFNMQAKLALTIVVTSFLGFLCQERYNGKRV